MTTKIIKTIADLEPDKRNANKGTVRGRAMLDHSLRTLGAGRSILADKNGRIIAGNKTLEVAADIDMPIEVITTRGDRLVVVQREDLDLETDPAARELAYADNRTGEVGLAWDAAAIAADLEAGIDLAELFDGGEIDDLLKQNAPLREQGKRTTAPRLSLADDPAAEEYRGWVKNVVVQFSGGKDSTLTLAWARQNLPDAHCYALYAEMGADYPGFITHVYNAAEALGAEPVIVRTDQDVVTRIVEHGWPAYFAPHCQVAMFNSLARWTREHTRPDDTLLMSGTQIGQKRAGAAKGASATKTLSTIPEYKHYSPLFNCDAASRDKLLADCGAPIWSGYGKGFRRTCCWCCPGQRDYVYALLRAYHPDLYAALSWLIARVGGDFPWAWEPKYKTMTLDEIADQGSAKLEERRLMGDVENDGGGDASDDDV